MRSSYSTSEIHFGNQGVVQSSFGDEDLAYSPNVGDIVRAVLMKAFPHYDSASAKTPGVPAPNCVDAEAGAADRAGTASFQGLWNSVVDLGFPQPPSHRPQLSRDRPHAAGFLITTLWPHDNIAILKVDDGATNFAMCAGNVKRSASMSITYRQYGQLSVWLSAAVVDGCRLAAARGLPRA